MGTKIPDSDADFRRGYNVVEYKGVYDDVHQENAELTLKNEVWIFNIRMCLIKISSLSLLCINYDIHQRIKC